MKFFVDTANVDEIREINSWGVVDGVTTNPSLVAKEGRNFEEVIAEITSIVNGPVSAEVISLESQEMIKEARELSKINENVVVKIPMTDEGLKAVSVVSKEGIKTNVTLVFSPNQALLAAKAGAAYVSPFVGRLDDIGNTGMDVVQKIVEIFDIYGIETEVITASVRHTEHVTEAALAGSHIATVPYAVFKKMLGHPLTDIGIDKFLADWEKASK